MGPRLTQSNDTTEAREHVVVGVGGEKDELYPDLLRQQPLCIDQRTCLYFGKGVIQNQRPAARALGAACISARS